MDEHLSDEQIAGLARAEVSKADRLQIVRHLLRDCPLCSQRIAACLSADVASPHESRQTKRRYSTAIQRAFRSLPQALESAKAMKALYGVEIPYRLTQEERVEFLIDKAFAARYRNADEMVRFAFWAKTAAETLPREELGERRVADLQARAWAAYGNALRVSDDFKGARESFAEAAARFKRGSRDLRVAAYLQVFVAAYHYALRDIPAAIELLEQAEAIYRELGDTHEVGRVLVARGLYEIEAEDFDAARMHLLASRDLLQPGRDPELNIAATKNHIFLLVQVGEYREAAKQLLASGLREALAESPLDLLRLRGIEGKIAAGLGRLDVAERAFQEVCLGFFDQKLGMEGALAGLELAEVHLRQGRHGECAALATTLYEKFREIGVEKEAERALQVLAEAAEEQILSGAMLFAVSDFLGQLRRNPQLRFRGF